MLTGIRHTAVLVLGLMLIAVVACGGDTQTADIPTPEARAVAKVDLEPSPTNEPSKLEQVKPFTPQPSAT